MDTLTFDGKEYISSKRAAKLSGYTKDYIGQLCRAGSLPAKIIGRSWYVEEGALKDHKKMYRGTPVMDATVWDVDKVEDDSKSLREVAAQYISEQEKIRKTELLDGLFNFKYEKDESPLIPQPTKQQEKPELSKKESVKIVRKPTVSRLNTMPSKKIGTVHRGVIREGIKDTVSTEQVQYGKISQKAGPFNTPSPIQRGNIRRRGGKKTRSSYSLSHISMVVSIGLLILTPVFVASLLFEKREVYENTGNGTYAMVKDNIGTSWWSVVATKTRALVSSVINLD